MKKILFALCVMSFVSPKLDAQGWTSANARLKPQRYVGKLVTFYKDASLSFASGVLVGKRHVLTAGHALIKEDLKWKNRPSHEWNPMVVMFTPGQRGRRAPYGSANATKWAISTQFLSGSHKARDFAIVRLNRDLATRTRGHAVLGRWNNLWTYRVTIRGYEARAEWPIRIRTRAWNDPTRWDLWNLEWSGWHQFISTRAPGGRGGVSGGPAMVGNTVIGIYTRGGRGRHLIGFRMSHTPQHIINKWMWANR